MYKFIGICKPWGLVCILIICTCSKPSYTSEEEVSISIGDSIRLEGTLTKPLTNVNKAPVVILVSPPLVRDRDNLTYKNVKMFAVLADSLSKHGIAVLRFDNRGFGKSSIWNHPVSLYTHADDVIAWINYLKTRKDINIKKIGLIGQSEGGCTSEVVASQPGKVSFLVLLASRGIGGWEAHEYVINRYWKMRGIQRKADLSDSINADIEYQKPLYDILNRYESIDSLPKYVAEKVINFIHKKYGNNLSRAEFIALLKEHGSQWVTPQQVALRKFQPVKYLSKIKCPVLALNGTVDDYIDCYPNLNVIEKSLKENGNANVTIVPFKNVDHSFLTMGLAERTYTIPQKGGHGTVTVKDSLPYYAVPNEKFFQPALDTITKWILKQ